MIAQATLARTAAAPGSPSLVGAKIPIPHRFHLTDGRVISGDLHKAPNTRLADHLSTLKGYISLTHASCEASGQVFPYILVNQDHVLFIEELHPPQQQAKVATPAARGDVPR